MIGVLRERRRSRCRNAARIEAAMRDCLRVSLHFLYTLVEIERAAKRLQNTAVNTLCQYNMLYCF